MPISGYVAGGASDALEEVLDRRLKEQIRQQQEKEHADQVAHQRQQIELQQRTQEDLAADRKLQREHQQKTFDLADLTRREAAAEKATQKAAMSDMGNVLNMPGMTPEQIQREVIGSSLRTGTEIPRPVVDLLKVPEKKYTSPQRTASGELVQFEEGNIPPGTRFYQEPKTPDKPTYVQVVGPDGMLTMKTPDEIRAAGGVPTVRGGVGGGRSVTANDAADLAGINEALKLTENLNFKPGDTGIAPGVGGLAPDWVTSLTGFGLEPKKRQGVINLNKQIIGKGLEGGVLRKEDEGKYEKILVTLSDPPEVAQAKITNLINTLQSKRQVRLEALQDAGYDVSKFNERAGAGGGKPRVRVSIDKDGNLVETPVKD